MVLRFKEGVSIRGLRDETVLAVVCAYSIFSDYGLDCVVTSGVDGQHSWGSLHYRGDAFDLRIKHITDLEGKRDGSKIDEIVEVLSDALTDDFDVVLEEDHIHVEFQPKHKH